ncbi:hypothetical protein [Streptomyces marianii]|uniref:hypothetical protein n=1 Tax=Streptomyces marianii TaxID=1817406 RepID=UPI001486AEFE|nr:hypothetical protein [Streptomyces marianii]
MLADRAAVLQGLTGRLLGWGLVGAGLAGSDRWVAEVAGAAKAVRTTAGRRG